MLLTLFEHRMCRYWYDDRVGQLREFEWHFAHRQCGTCLQWLRSEEPWAVDAVPLDDGHRKEWNATSDIEQFL